MRNALKTFSPKALTAAAKVEYQVTVIGPRGGLVFRQVYRDYAMAREAFTDMLAKYLDYNVEISKVKYEM